jgi:hypothetical protein
MRLPWTPGMPPEWQAYFAPPEPPPAVRGAEVVRPCGCRIDPVVFGHHGECQDAKGAAP